MPMDLDNVFTYHPPFGNQAERYEALRNSARNFAWTVQNFTPESREQSVALTNIQQAVMWANAAIAINETEKKEEGTK